MDYSRQSEIFNNAEFNTPINIIGAGATGGWVALQLAKMGIKNITVYDFDTVEEHNIPNQVYRIIDIGKPKVVALKEIIKDATGIDITTKVEEVNGRTKLEGIVFMLTDTMSSRKEIFEKALKMRYNVKLVIETRMGLTNGRLYNINPLDITAVKEYEKTLYSDEEATVSFCGTSQSIVSTAMYVSSLAVSQLVSYHNDIKLANELLFSLSNNLIMPTNWGV